MALGNEIILSPEPRGRFFEGTIEGTPKPGTLMQIKAATEPVNGRYTYEAYNRAADGDRYPLLVLLPDHYQGKTATDAYVTGTRGFLYAPLPGDELNVLKGDVSGTADDFAIGDMLMIDDGTGKVIATTGTPEAEPFVCLETVTDPTADQLVHVFVS